MKPSEVIKQATALSGESYNTEIWLSWLNMAQAELQGVSQIPSTVEVPLTKGVSEYDVPMSLLEVKRVAIQHGRNYTETLLRLHGNDYNQEGYYIEGNKIVLQHVDLSHDSRMKVIGFKKLKYFNEEDLDKPIDDVPEEHHPLYVHYLVARASQKEEWQTQQEFAYSEWLQGKEALRRAQRAKLPPIRVKPRRWY